MNTNGQLLETLTGSDVFQNFERAYTDATGMPVAMRPVETWQLPFHGKRRENSFCSIMAGKSRTCAACLQTQEKLAQSAADGPAAITCAYGLCEMAVLVKRGAKTIGFLQTGQIMRRKPTGASYQHAVARGKALGADFDSPKVKEDWFATPVLSPEQTPCPTELSDFAFTASRAQRGSSRDQPIFGLGSRSRR